MHLGVGHTGQRLQLELAGQTAQGLLQFLLVVPPLLDLLARFGLGHLILTPAGLFAFCCLLGRGRVSPLVLVLVVVVHDLFELVEVLLLPVLAVRVVELDARLAQRLSLAAIRGLYTLP